MISVIRRWAGSGGRAGRWRCDANNPPGGPSRAASGVPAARRRGLLMASGPGSGQGDQAEAPRPFQRWSVAARSTGNVTNGLDHRETARSKPINIARGTPAAWRTCGSIRLRQASMSRGVEVRGSFEDPAFRAPSFFQRPCTLSQATACPGPQRIRATARICCLILILRRREAPSRRMKARDIRALMVRDALFERSSP